MWISVFLSLFFVKVRTQKPKINLKLHSFLGKVLLPLRYIPMKIHEQTRIRSNSNVIPDSNAYTTQVIGRKYMTWIKIGQIGEPVQ
jgi:hypothetical protein